MAEKQLPCPLSENNFAAILDGEDYTIVPVKGYVPTAKEVSFMITGGGSQNFDCSNISVTEAHSVPPSSSPAKGQPPATQQIR